VNQVYIEDPAGGPYSGIYCFNPYAAGVYAVDVTGLLPGYTIEVTGTYVEYYELSEIQLQAVELIDATTTVVAATPVDPADVATGGALLEPYEGVLVVVGPVTVTANDIGFGKFVVTDGLEIDDELYMLSSMPPLDTVYTSITGVLTFTFSTVQLNPRRASDYILAE
jgi:hypothetical protein